MGNLKLIFALLFAFSITTTAHALEEQMKNFRGVRSSGMGGVITTTGNYSEALFGNPARHSEVDAWKLTMLDLSMEVNSSLLSSTSEISALRNASGANTISSVSKLTGKNEHIRVEVMPSYYNPKLFGNIGFAFGFLMSAQTNLLLHYTTDIDTETVVDAGPNMGFSTTFFDDRLSVGFNLHLLYRVSADDSISALNFLTGSKLSLSTFGKQGIGVDGDLGAYYHIPWEPSFMRVNVGASLNNLAKSSYNLGEVEILKTAGAGPTNNDRTLSMGVRLDFPDTWIFTAPLLAIEMQDIGDTRNRVSNVKRSHIGAEAKLSRVVSLRTGLNQGYLTGGIGFDLPVLKLDFATYGEELSGNAGITEDRRFIARIAFEL